MPIAIILLLLKYILPIIAIIYPFRKYNQLGIKSFIPLLIMVLFFIQQAIVNYSTLYAKTNHYFNRANRVETIEMYEAGQLKEYSDSSYIVPHRLSALSKLVYIETDEYRTTAIFDISANQDIVYVSDDKIMVDGAMHIGTTNSDYKNPVKLDINWYVVRDSNIIGP